MLDDGNPLISIITVSRNAAEKLKKTVRSVAVQRYYPVEHIVIDGGSTDSSREVLEKNGDKLSYWISEEDEGIYDAMNKGLKQATGDWIHFLNAGDEYTGTESLRIMAERLDGKYSVVYCDIWLKKMDGTFQLWKQKPVFRKGIFNNVCHQAVFYNRSKVGEMLFQTRFKVSADTHLLLEICTKDPEYGFSRVGKPLVIYEEEGLSFNNFSVALKERSEHFKAWLKSPTQRWLNLWNLQRQKLKYYFKQKRSGSAS